MSNRIFALLLCSLLLTGLTTPAKDAAPMPAGNFPKVRVGILAGAHLFRTGSRIRVSVEAPGGDRRIWRFETPETDGLVVDEVARTSAQPSRIVVTRNGG